MRVRAVWTSWILVSRDYLFYFLVTFLILVDNKTSEIHFLLMLV